MKDGHCADEERSNDLTGGALPGGGLDPRDQTGLDGTVRLLSRRPPTKRRTPSALAGWRRAKPGISTASTVQETAIDLQGSHGTPGGSPFGSPTALSDPFKASRTPLTCENVRPLGFEPRTCGLRVRCSTIELEARGRDST